MGSPCDHRDALFLSLSDLQIYIFDIQNEMEAQLNLQEGLRENPESVEQSKQKVMELQDRIRRAKEKQQQRRRTLEVHRALHRC